MYIIHIFIGITGWDLIRSKEMFKPWLSQLKQCVEQLPKVRIQERNENATQYSVEFSYAIGKTSIDVDLLVSPDWDEPCDFYDFLRDKVKKKDRMQ